MTVGQPEHRRVKHGRSREIPLEMECCPDNLQRQRHQQLAGVVKGVHAKLRKELKISSGDYAAVWAGHCQDTCLLEEYAEAMKHLATDIWPNNPESRIHWCSQTCIDYFLQDGLKKTLEKDVRREMHKCDRYDDVLISDGTLTAAPVMMEKSESVHPESGYGCPSSASGAVVLSCSRNAAVLNDEMINNDGKLSKIQSLPDLDPEHEGTIPDDSISDVSLSVDSVTLDTKLSYKLRSNVTHGYQREGNTPAIQKSSIGPDVLSKSEVLGSRKGSCDGSKNSTREYNAITLPFEGKVRILDVGSCYNPFLEFEEFLALGIDLCPAVESVYQCDFLNIDITEPLRDTTDAMTSYLDGLCSPVQGLPQAGFHVVVFSLLLEYFPSPLQRCVCCEKAHKLLALNGLLLIITPDSSHQNRNAPMIRSWRVAIESLGFRRWRYVKQEHLHCMAFRKVVCTTSKGSQFKGGDVGADMMYIPQDFRDPETEESVELCSVGSAPRSEEENLLLRENFLELPDIIDE